MSDAKIISEIVGDHIDLGLRLNHLIDRGTKLGTANEEKRGLALPSQHDHIGSGIVVIIGDPGSGKSTLTLQMAVAAARQGFDSAYISLEEERERVRKKAEIFGWEKYLWKADVPALFESEALFAPGYPVMPLKAGLMADFLRECRSKSNGQHTLDQGKILLPGLLPRPLAKAEARLNKFFWEQYRQIEFLVRASAEHNQEVAYQTRQKFGIRLVVIDSLNMLGVEPQNREMLHRLFDLFRQNRIMGIFTVERDTDIGFDSTMGDVIFKFSRDTSAGYEIQLLECAKSRFTNRTQGCHPYKIVAPNKKVEHPDGEVGVVVYPSPHAVVAATGEDQKNEKPDEEKFPFGWGAEITRQLLRSQLHRGNVVALAGPPGTFKTQIALNFLLHGLAADESVLYLRLRTPEKLNLSRMMPYDEPVLLSPTLSADGEQNKELEKEIISRTEVIRLHNTVDIDTVESEILQGIVTHSKAKISVYKDNGRADSNAKLIVVDFSTGMLLAEEFTDIVMRRVFHKHGSEIRRVVLDDVGVIGASYPLLRRSFTTGDLFLSAFVHVMKNKRKDVLVVGTTGELTESNFMVHQACSLADAILRTNVGTIYGDKHVLLTGDGMAARNPDSKQKRSSTRDQTPPVVLSPSLRDGVQLLTPDGQLLDEFVGFDTGRIERPGIVLHLYSENEIQENYNDKVVKRLQERYGKPSFSRERGFSGVKAINYGPDDLSRFDRPGRRPTDDKPRDHTAVRMIDEFEQNQNPTAEEYQYMRNVLLMAYRTDLEETTKVTGFNLEKCENWDEIYAQLRNLRVTLKYQRGLKSASNPNGLGRIDRTFCYDRLAPETLACLVLSAVICGGGISWHDKINFADEFATAIKNETIRNRVVAAFNGLHDLLFRESRSISEEIERSPFDQSSKGRKTMPDDAAVYVCWYDQLRELLIRHPYLAPRIRIRALPFGSFKGDWHLQVDPGSVSIRLGVSIIESFLSPSEDFERFRAGVCLPVRVQSDGGQRLAWAGAHRDVLLKDVLKIWKDAHKRSQIDKYHRFNRLLRGVGDMLVGNCFDRLDENAAVDVDNLVTRLPQMVADLCNAETDINALRGIAT